MRLRPDIVSILELARDIIREDFTAESDFEDRRYETFMMANALAIAARQVDTGASPERDELHHIRSILDDASPNKTLSDLNLALSKQLRSGNFDPGKPLHEDVRTLLTNSARQAVSEYNPKYLGSGGDT